MAFRNQRTKYENVDESLKQEVLDQIAEHEPITFETLGREHFEDTDPEDVWEAVFNLKIEREIDNEEGTIEANETTHEMWFIDTKDYKDR